jgi:hypothetical protein
MEQRLGANVDDLFGMDEVESLNPNTLALTASRLWLD